jgi:hypothetical protein
VALGFGRRRTTLWSWADTGAGPGDVRKWAREIRAAGLRQSGYVR